MGNQNSYMNGYDRYWTPDRPPCAADLELNLRWQWDNNRESIEQCIERCRAGDQEGAIRALCLGQRHNGNVCNDYRTFRVEALQIVMRLYGGGGPVPGYAPPAAPRTTTVPVQCNQGHTLGPSCTKPMGTTCVVISDPSGNWRCPHCPSSASPYYQLSHVHH